MQVTAYCFLPGVKFEPLPKPFKVKDGVAWIGNDHEPFEMGKKQEVRGCFLSYQSPANIDDFLRFPEDSSDPQHKKELEQIGKLLDKYRGELSEVVAIVEGLISVLTIRPFPAFQVEHVNVRLVPETQEDKKLVTEGKVRNIFGDIGRARDPQMAVVNRVDEMLAHVPRAGERLSALSIYTLAARAEDRFEFEIAYSNFFRIIEGYLGDGSKNMEVALQARSSDLMTVLAPTPEFVAGLTKILVSLNLPVKAKLPTDEKEIISDLVLLRHKLMHYNLTNQNRHFYSSLRVDLKAIIRDIHGAAYLLLRNDIDGEKVANDAQQAQAPLKL